MSRDERRQFENDVFYDAWSRGLNPDRAIECADDCYYDRRTPSECVNGYERQVHVRQEEQRIEREAEEMQQQEAIYHAMLERQAMEAAYEQACIEDAAEPKESP